MIAANRYYVAYNLTHPDDIHAFAYTVVFLVVTVVGVVAGLGATAQNYRGGERRTPRWLGGGLAGLAGWGVGAILIGTLIAAMPRAGASVGISPETLAGLPALAAQNAQFDRAVIRAKVRETVALRLDNRDNRAHSFDIDVFNLHVPMPPSQSGMAVFRPTQAGTYTFYCLVPSHREAGMVGKLIVTP